MSLKPWRKLNTMDLAHTQQTLEMAMSSQKKVTVSAVLSYSVVFSVALLARAALAQNPASEKLKSQIIRWDDAKPRVADWGEMRRYFQGQTFATEKAFVAVAVVHPGKSVHKAHRHGEEEYLAIVDGVGTWWLEGKESQANKGDILYVQPWIYHRLTNTGDRPLIFLVFKYNGKGVQPPQRPDDRPDELTVQLDGAPAEPPKMAKVGGTVTLNGEPLEGAVVVFAAKIKTGHAALGRTDEQGRYVLTTFEEGDGAVAD